MTKALKYYTRISIFLQNQAPRYAKPKMVPLYKMEGASNIRKSVRNAPVTLTFSVVAGLFFFAFHVIKKGLEKHRKQRQHSKKTLLLPCRYTPIVLNQNSKADYLIGCRDKLQDLFTNHSKSEFEHLLFNRPGSTVSAHR